METHVFKKVDDLEIRADVYRATGERPQPAVLFIHGGGLIMGSRKAILPSQIAAFNSGGFHFVSIDYRLAPETRLPSMVEDIRDAWAWLCEQAPSLGIDGERIALLGHSAGAYLALLGGFKLDPRPAAVVSLAGFGEVARGAFAAPSPHHLSEHELVEERDARQTVGGAPISESGPNDSMQYYSGRGLFYLFCRQQGIWLSEVSGNDSGDPDGFAEYEPLHNISAEYPPTMLLHGELDTDVSVEQSDLMRQELLHNGVATEFLRNPNWGHAFLYMPNDDSVPKAFSEIVAFLGAHV